MSNQINKMIKAARQQKREQERLFKEREQAEMHEADVAIQAALGETLFAELVPYMKARITRVTPHGGIRVDLEVQADALEIADFIIVYTKHSQPTGVALATRGAIDSRVKLETAKQLAQFLLERRVCWQQETAYKRGRRTQELFHILQKEYSEELAKDAAAELAKLDPDQAELAQSLLSNWYERYRVWHAQEAIKADYKREIDAAYQSYSEQMYNYYLEVFKTEHLNEDKVLEFQERLNKRYPYFLLTYALVAGEEGQKYIETRTVYSAEAQPDEQGFWPIWKDAEIQLAHYTHVVSVKKVYVRLSSRDSNLFKFTWIAEDDALGFWHHPSEDLSDLPALVASLELPPDIPNQPPVDLDNRWCADTVAEHARVRAIKAIGEEMRPALFSFENSW